MRILLVSDRKHLILATDFLNETDSTMDTDSDTFEFHNTAPEQLALDLLQKCTPRTSQVKQRAIAKKALEISENCLDAWILLARNYKLFPQSRKTYLKAISIAEKIVSPKEVSSAIFTSYLTLLKEFGSRCYRYGDYPQAINVFTKALTLDAGDPLNISSELVLCYLYSDQIDAAADLCAQEPYHSTLSAKVSLTYILFRQALPHWTADQLEELEYELLDQTTWQWMHAQCESLKRHFRAINHSNAFLTFFLLNPNCHSISLPESISPGRASEALAVAQAHSDLWQHEALPLRLLEEFPWTNPTKRDILAQDKPLLKTTIAQLEEHREQVRCAAERDYLGDNELY